MLVGVWEDATAVENSLAAPQELNTQSPYDPAAPRLRMYLRELKTGS